MRKPPCIKTGDKVAIVSLSSGILGEEGCRHQVDLGIKRLREGKVHCSPGYDGEYGIIRLFEPEEMAADSIH